MGCNLESEFWSVRCLHLSFSGLSYLLSLSSLSASEAIKLLARPTLRQPKHTQAWKVRSLVCLFFMGYHGRSLLSAWCIQKKICWARKMAQMLGVLAALPEDTSSILSTHTWMTQNVCHFNCGGLTSFSALFGHLRFHVHMPICRETCIHTNNNKKNKSYKQTSGI